MADQRKTDSESESKRPGATAHIPTEEEFDASVERARLNVKATAKGETAGEQVGDDILNFRLKCAFNGAH
jgi:hypothetical protein